ncbi:MULTISPECIES: carboxylesterase/lipase family protein [unclassified Rhodococcus (in: high G+C Gram-positive bacteria)]|uniref:carboxylesterase/lipase family protein n=1 Tax=unclassified Rhodococcus (in: high G+C Gram-positive bacteria) TaxID=192944 RepID=UPI0006F8842C|nr:MULTISPECIES: carboxylesterase/lipase family protein [unclassified Rhodococcus (in: high G+C Gram-positive bacteria)]KQU39326.1 carboxylesterase [Rhodococcus sp. Leaf225]KQU43762.1 carboxylesterase [Rhodococcus sp. Leaf258]
MGQGDFSTEITTSEGRVRGFVARGIAQWRGIPYAQPPVGPLRLRAPQPPTAWEGVRDATRWGDAAVQDSGRSPIGPIKGQGTSEDCLTLNVSAPATTLAGPRPVMVFIHGGAYTLGTSATSMYSGTSLVRRGDIVYVSLNYRLGALGYLDFRQFSTPDRTFDSNLGLRDQVAALQWVQRNIAAFGGDPDNVTIFGESAGGNAVTTLTTVPATKGLFHKAISQSSAPGMVATSDRSEKWGRDFVELLGATPDTAADTLAGADVADLLKAAHRLGSKSLKETPGLIPFGPSVDGDYVPEAPLEAYRSGRAHPVPMIIGSNEHEGTLFPKWLDALPTNAERIDRLFANTDPSARDRILAEYPGYPKGLSAIDFGGDITFWRPSLEIADAHTEHAPTYVYRYDYSPRLFDLLKLYSTHGSELFAVFGVYRARVGKFFAILGDWGSSVAVTDEVQKQWLAFARTGAPEADWTQYEVPGRATRIFDSATRMENDPLGSRRAAWEGFSGYDTPTGSSAGTESESSQDFR